MYRGLRKVVKDAKFAAGCDLGGKGKLTQVRMKKWSQSTSTACRRRMTCSMTIVMSIGAGRSKRWPLVLTLIRCNKELSTFAASYSPWPSSRKTTSETCSSRALSERATTPSLRDLFQYVWVTWIESVLWSSASVHVLPFLEHLSKPDLLEHCMSLGTSNANESPHSVIWQRAPKAVFTTRSTVELAAAFGVVRFKL